MKFHCACGTTIVDQADSLPHKALVISDADFFEFLSRTESRHASPAKLVRAAYECRECGRLWIEDRGRRLRSFVPEVKQNRFLASMTESG